MARRIEVGSKLRKTDTPGYTIEVIEFISHVQGPPHVRTRVRLQNHDLGERLYSVAALNDQRLFIKISE
jgi:hypothetical protein